MINTKRPVILVSNDDGVNAQGIAALVDIAKKFGDVVVVAPEEGQSGQSHAITSKLPLRLRKVKSEDGAEWYAVNGTPADCVKLAMNQILKHKPDLLISGVNHGSNSSVSVIYSGTIGAAVEGTLYGIPSVGFSLLDHSPKADFSAVEQWFSPIIKKVMEEGLPHFTLLNVNIPNISADKVRGYKFSRVTHGNWREEFDQRQDPFGRNYYWLTGYFHNEEPSATDTDEWALANGYVAIVPLYIDWTHQTYLKKMQMEWNLENESSLKKQH